MSHITKKAEEIAPALLEQLGDIEEAVMDISLADVIRMGEGHTEQAHGWGDGYATACALTSAAIVAKGIGLV